MIDMPPKRRAALWGAIGGACIYGILAATIITRGVRLGGEGRVGAMLALIVCGFPATIVGVLLGRATVGELAFLALLGVGQWTVVGYLLARWLRRRAAARGRSAS
jgi:hypothetical protein